ncbi:MAG: cobalamin B12-binding domain-containing protein [Pseudomonadota bacterium]
MKTMPKKQRKVRILIAKPGLDTHERGAKLIAAALRDAGMEVIYTGVFQMKESIVQTAIEEDVDIIGLSYLCGAHLSLTGEILEELKVRGLDDVPVICGGIIPDDDIAQMKAIGVKAVYGPGTPLEEIIEDVRNLMP